LNCGSIDTASVHCNGWSVARPCCNEIGRQFLNPRQCNDSRVTGESGIGCLPAAHRITRIARIAAVCARFRSCWVKFCFSRGANATVTVSWCGRLSTLLAPIMFIHSEVDSCLGGGLAWQRDR
jgi:hypothetical protein